MKTVNYEAHYTIFLQSPVNSTLLVKNRNLSSLSLSPLKLCLKGFDRRRCVVKLMHMFRNFPSSIKTKNDVLEVGFASVIKLKHTT